MARVKVYQLNAEGQWDDKGTGNVHHHIANDGDGDFVILTVQCEETQEILLEHRIEDKIDYSRQGGTIITWCEPKDIDLALSFQETSQCDEIWEQVTLAQAKSGHDLATTEDADGGDDDYDDPGTMIPFPDRTNLTEVCRRICMASPANKDMVANRLLADGYLRKLFELFEASETEELMEELHLLFNIFKGMFMLNDQALLEVVLSEEHILNLVAVLEYDPLLPAGTSSTRHRTFLKGAQFREPVPIQKPDILSKIHLNYRMGYIKDVILLRYLDDTTMGSLNSLIFFNNLAVVTGLSEDEQFMKDFFSELHRLAAFSPTKAAGSYMSNLTKKKSKDVDEGLVAKRKNLFLFLQELCLLAKTLQVPLRDDFYKQLGGFGLFRAIEDALAASSPPTESELWIWLCSADILTNAMNHDPALLRSYLTTRLAFPENLLGCLLSALVSPEVGAGLADQLAQILRMVLDPDSMQGNDKDQFLDHFYAKHVHKLVTAVCTPLSTTNYHQVCQYQACEMLSFCVHQHGYRIKQHILNHDVATKVSCLLRAKGRPNLVCSAVRFLRFVIGLKDDMIARQLVGRKVLDQLIEVFTSNGSRYNLLNSAVIEIVHFIRQENIKILVDYLVRNHEEKFSRIDYVQTFQELRLRWEQNQEYQAQAGGGEGAEGNGQGATDESEYSYFEKDSDDESTATATGPQPAGAAGAAAASEAESPVPVEGGAVDDEKQREFLKQTELLLQKRPREDEEDVDLVARARKRTGAAPSRPAGGAINISLKARGSS